jgi:hypothetical protein
MSSCMSDGCLSSIGVQADGCSPAGGPVPGAAGGGVVRAHAPATAESPHRGLGSIEPGRVCVVPWASVKEILAAWVVVKA